MYEDEMAWLVVRKTSALAVDTCFTEHEATDKAKKFASVYEDTFLVAKVNKVVRFLESAKVEVKEVYS